MFESKARESLGKAVFVEVDVGKMRTLGMRFRVSATPTFVSFAKGEKVCIPFLAPLFIQWRWDWDCGRWANLTVLPDRLMNGRVQTEPTWNPTSTFSCL